MTDNVQESISAFNSKLAKSSEIIREAWRTLLNSDNRDAVLKMREADYTLHSVPRKITSIKEQLETKRSKKGQARLAELKDHLKLANNVLTEPTMQLYQSIYQQASAELDQLLKELNAIEPTLDNADEALFPLLGYTDRYTYKKHCIDEVNGLIKVTHRGDRELLNKVDYNWPDYFQPTYENKARDFLRRYGLPDSPQRQRRRRSSRLSFSESAYGNNHDEQSLGGHGLGSIGHYRRSVIYGRTF